MPGVLSTVASSKRLLRPHISVYQGSAEAPKPREFRGHKQTSISAGSASPQELHKNKKDPEDKAEFFPPETQSEGRRSSGEPSSC